MKRSVLVTLHPSDALTEACERGAGAAEALAHQPLPAFEPHEQAVLERLDAPSHRSRRMGMRRAAPVFEVAGSVEEGDLAQLQRHAAVARVEANPAIATHVCDDRTSVRPHLAHEAIGTYEDVRRALDQATLAQHGMTGANVFIAILDTGISLDFLRAVHGLTPRTEAAASRSYSHVEPYRVPAEQAGHGTAMAFNALLVAPEATLLDIPILSDDPLDDLLVDARHAYGYLLSWMQQPAQEKPRLVVSNSWGLKNLEEDLPRAQPGNYSHNPDHSFNQAVEALAEAGADILFSAGNCGGDGPGGGQDVCSQRGPQTIYGANAHPDVLTVSAVDVNHCRLTASSEGPGALGFDAKPDVCAYAHFRGAETPASTVDRATSTACAVATSAVAAIRSWYSAEELPPARLRQLITASTDGLGTTGHDHRYGYGVINVPKLLTLLP